MRRPLPRASTIWLGIIGGAAALDWIADRGDPDGDTITEQTCVLLSKIPGGRAVLLPAACVVVPAWFYNHIESRFDLRLEIIRSLHATKPV